MIRINLISTIYKTSSSPFEFVDILFKEKIVNAMNKMIDILKPGIFVDFYIFKFYGANELIEVNKINKFIF